MKDKSKMDISDLLAQRDRRLVDAQVLDQQDDLDELNRLTAEVQNQVDVPVPDHIWDKVQSYADSNAAPSTRSLPRFLRWQQYPLATAASVLLVSLLTVFGVYNGMSDDQAAIESMPVVQLQKPPSLVALMDRSQVLEREAYGAGAWQPEVQSNLSVSPFGEVVLLRLAQVDDAISQTPPDDPRMAALWEQRVNLLQVFLAEMETQNPGRFEDNRSL